MSDYQQRFAKFCAKFQGYEDVVQRMVGMFIQDAPVRLAQAKDGSESRDWEAVIKAAHSLVNIAGTMQAFEVAELARKMEAAARARSYDEFAQLCDAVQLELDSILAVLASSCDTN